MHSMASKLSFKGTVYLYLDGKLVRKVPNMVVNAGLALIATLVTGTGTAPCYVAIGTGTTSPQKTDTALETEYARGVATRYLMTTSVTNDTAAFERIFTFTESKSITEAGLLNAGTAGTLVARSTFTAVSVQNGSELLVRWTLQVA